MTRFVSVCVAVAGVISTASVAAAGETGMLPNGARITFERFFMKDRSGEFAEPPNDEDLRFYLNFAHCDCAKRKQGPEQTFQYEIKISNTTGTARPAEVWVGSGCDNDQTRPMNCVRIDSQAIGDIDALVTTPKLIELSLFDVINAKDMGACRKTNGGDALVWILVDTNGDGSSYEYTSSQAIAGSVKGMTVTKFDTQEPMQPTDFRAESGEGSVNITWTPPTGGTSDIYYYQALCADANGQPLTGISAPSERFQTTNNLCDDPPVKFDLAPAEVVDGTGAIIPPLDAFREINRDYVCGEAPATAQSLSVDGLENDTAYQVAIVVVDQYGNVAGSYFNQLVTPKPVTDFWEDLHDRNSAVDGGCLLARTYGDGGPLTQTLRAFRDDTLAKTALGRALTRAYYATAGKLGFLVEQSLVLRVLVAIWLAPAVMLALLWHWLSLPGLLLLVALACWRPRFALGDRARVLAAAGALCILVPRAATADDFQPYWETEENDDSSLLDVPEVDWHVGIRLGPYIPEIDLQAGLNAATGLGPYEAMFGTYWTRQSDGTLKKHERNVWQVLPMLDVDRVVWSNWGQITVGGSLGYMQKSAYAYKDGTTQDDLMRERSTASRNTFRLIPAAALVGYRLTILDDLWGVPIVPYVRAGLSYYMWWIKGPSGDTSRVCESLDASGSCAKLDKAYGASLGFQGSIGIAIRAERVDTDAAISMRNSGISHAGFYAELQYAKVDGFGSDSKLSVGDNTWFAGVDFEF